MAFAQSRSGGGAEHAPHYGPIFWEPNTILEHTLSLNLLHLGTHTLGEVWFNLGTKITGKCSFWWDDWTGKGSLAKVVNHSKTTGKVSVAEFFRGEGLLISLKESFPLKLLNISIVSKEEDGIKMTMLLGGSLRMVTTLIPLLGIWYEPLNRKISYLVKFGHL